MCGYVYLGPNALKGQRHQTPWSWSYRQLRTAQSRCAEPNSGTLEEHHALLPWATSPSSPFLVSNLVFLVIGDISSHATLAFSLSSKNEGWTSIHRQSAGVQATFVSAVLGCNWAPPLRTHGQTLSQCLPPRPCTEFLIPEVFLYWTHWHFIGPNHLSGRAL